VESGLHPLRGTCADVLRGISICPATEHIGCGDDRNPVALVNETAFQNDQDREPSL
jgi:hypothetical protein